jgi:hypothetical protein
VKIFVGATPKVNCLKLRKVFPFVESQDEIFLKAAFPSRKYIKHFGLMGEI